MARSHEPASIDSGAGRLLVCAMLIGVLAQCPGGVNAMTTEELAVWAEGPVRWLLLPKERKHLKQIDGSAEARSFVEIFWRRRDRDPLHDGNSFQETFFERVEAADILYGDEAERGSLTDRGRALILLGPPAHVTVSTEPVMAWDPASQRDDRVTMRLVDVEIWGYRLDGLPQGMKELLMAKKKGAGDSTALTVMFRTVGRRTTLVEGEELLEIAARAAVRPVGGD